MNTFERISFMLQKTVRLWRSNCTLVAQQLYHGGAATVPWWRSNCTLVAQQLYHGCVATVPWLRRNCTMVASRLYLGCAATVPWLHSNCTMVAQQPKPAFAGNYTGCLSSAIQLSCKSLSKL